MRWTYRVTWYSGNDQHHNQGVGIFLNRSAAQASGAWKHVNERIITARLCTRHAKVYTPTKIAAGCVRDELYDLLQDMLDEIPSFDIKLVIGHINTKLS